MKYFTMDELNDIANELLNNPSRETLRFLNDKYNKSIETSNVDSNNTVDETPANGENLQVTVSAPEENNIPKVETPIWQPAEQLINQPSIYASSINNDSKSSQEMVSTPQMDALQSTPQESTLSIPTLGIQPDMSMPINSTPAINPPENQVKNLEINQIDTNSNSNTINPVQFSGNLWESQDNQLNNMMQTTDNFNNNLETESNTNINNNFFNPLPEETSSSIPIYETTAQEGPTMFGQLEQNFSNDKAA